jgi:drug/metabolite transporter (DMT)-like permease
VAGAVCIGFAPIFVRLTDVGYTACAFWRVALALPLLGALWYPRRVAAANRGPVRGLLLAGLFFAADLGVWHQSIRYTSVANATLLANLAPVFVTAGAVFLFRERIGARFLAGLIVAICGSALLVAHSFRVSLATVGGDVLGMITAVFYAGYLLTVSRQRRSASALDLMWWSTLACAAALLPAVLLLGEPMWPASARGWAVLIGLALLSQVAGQGLIAWAMAHLPAAFSSVSLLVQPVAAALLAWLLLAEPFGPLQALGGAVVLSGIVMCRLALVVHQSHRQQGPGAP